MKLSLRVFLLISILLISAVAVCQMSDTQKHSSCWPPESSIVKENGSIPPGFKTTLSSADIEYDCINCNSQNRYAHYLRPNSKVAASSLMDKLKPYLKKIDDSEKEKLLGNIEDHLMWWMVRAVLIEGNNNNFGAIALNDMYWTDDQGNRQPLIVFRSGFTPNPRGENSCFRTLIREGNVKHVVNLYDGGELPMEDLIEGEREVARELGVDYAYMVELDYGQWRNTIRKHPEQGPERESAMKSVARLIKEQIIMPGGEPPRGNILVHCGGGMHRTGMIVGILEKMINGKSMEEIEKTYRYHVGYKDKDHPGGFEQGNLDFINEFKEEYLR